MVNCKANISLKMSLTPSDCMNMSTFLQKYIHGLLLYPSELVFFSKFPVLPISLGFWGFFVLARDTEVAGYLCERNFLGMMLSGPWDA